MLLASAYRGQVYVVSETDGDTHLEKVAVVTCLNSERFEYINRKYLSKRQSSRPDTVVDSESAVLIR